MSNADHLLPVSAVARMLVFDRRTITRMCESGQLAATKIRGRWRISEQSVRALMPKTSEDAA